MSHLQIRQSCELRIVSPSYALWLPLCHRCEEAQYGRVRLTLVCMLHLAPMAEWRIDPKIYIRQRWPCHRRGEALCVCHRTKSASTDQKSIADPHGPRLNRGTQTHLVLLEASPQWDSRLLCGYKNY